MASSDIVVFHVLQTFALDDSAIPLRYQAIWHVVHSAQQAAIIKARNGTVTAAVDRAARKIIKDAGYGEFFTHRLGHGEQSPFTLSRDGAFNQQDICLRNWAGGARVSLLAGWLRRYHSDRTYIL